MQFTIAKRSASFARLAMITGVGLLASGSVLSGAVAAQPVVVVSDDFSSPDYSIFNFNFNDFGTNLLDLSFSGFTEESTGGNPDEFLQVTHSHVIDTFDDPNPVDTDTFVQSVLTNEAVLYNPSTSGAINTISFSIDVRTSDPIDSAFFGVGNPSGGGSFAGFTNVNADGEFNTVTFDLATNADFSAVDFLGADDLEFSFGFSSSLSDFPPGFDGEFDAVPFTIDVDNFVVTINAVPEPSSAAAMLLIAALATASRRRIIRQED